jgi:threonine dehydratase
LLTPRKSGVEAAYAKLKAILPPTPLLPLDLDGVRIWCKCESDQPVGAFKIRGAWHRLSDLDEEQRARGVVAFSSGNHAQGVAWAARKLGIRATIVMPADAPRIKLEGTRALGATIILYDRAREDRVEIAQRIAREAGAVIVPAFDDRWIIEGQGSIGLEAAKQLGFAPDLFVAPCGGGGLASGLALALPDAAIAIVEPDGWDAMGQSLAAGRLVPVSDSAPETLCDSLQPPSVSPLTLGVLAGRQVQAVSLSDHAACAAMRLAWDGLGKRIEPGGAMALAAIMTGAVKPVGTTLVILSGGNVDDDLFNRIIAG